MTLNYKQMLLLDVLINQSVKKGRRHIIFSMEQDTYYAEFYKREDIDDLVEIQQLYSDYATFYKNSDAVRELQEQNQMMIELDKDAANIEEQKEMLMDNEILYCSIIFIESIDVMDYIKGEDVSYSLYNIFIDQEDHVEYLVDAGTLFSPIVLAEDESDLL